MRLDGLGTLLDSSADFGELLGIINGGHTPVSINGVSEHASAHLLFCLSKKLSKTVFIVVQDAVTARQLHGDLTEFFGDGALLFPESELIFYDIDVQAKDLLSRRMQVLAKMMDGTAKAVVCTVNALLGPTVPREAFDRRFAFCVGDVVDINQLSELFVHLGYTREEVIEGRGQFSIRGGIIDFYSHTDENPIRIELFDDEVDSIREFDVYSQRSLSKLESACVTPAAEIILTKEKKEELIQELHSLAAKTEDAGKKYLYHDIDRLENGVNFPSIYKYLPLISEEIPTVTDYLDDAVVAVLEPGRCSESAKSCQWQVGETVTSFKEKEMIPDIEGDWICPYSAAMTKLQRFPVIGLAGLSAEIPELPPKAEVTIHSQEQSPFYGKVEFFTDAMRQYRKMGYTVVVFGGSDVKAKNITEYLSEEELDAVYQDEIEQPIPAGSVVVTRGALHHGFEYPALKLAFISDSEIFGSDRKKKRKTLKKNSEKLSTFTDLSIGDYVVHQHHGIGQYNGIKTMTKAGATSDYLHIKFNGNDSLYVPTNQLDLLYKYTGKEGAHVRLNKLGGTQWEQTKARVQKGCEDMARQLIELYAARQNIEGVAFSPDGEWHRQFAATFPYEETDDQLKAIEEVSSDMEKPQPMDRLLCGDVGYGKTEIALRAAFKAVMDGYQVAYLVPTTILANQHYNTFCERMKQFPVKVEMLSRFRTAKEQRETIERIKNGETDILIGTHRIIQKDIEFKKLGLLIIDEEQRFGVAHKEQLKEIRKSVDVLTLSATPIPRTLHMSMVGIRDMSVLENPPKDRYPVATYVLEYNPEIVKDAILKEVGRGGQVYYLHNRVQTIEKVAEQIRTFAPGLRVAVGHGKMSERELEDIMQMVLDKEVDVLVCTTIIETGLDIPNVNTIIVEDADKMGLSQLYQLRGRVGRSNRLAYAYLIYKRDRILNEAAEKRLRAIRDFTEFGSGFKIALRDLEIRGAGNVVGAQQHGHMDAVGYDMYCKLLSEAVSGLKGETAKTNVTAVVSLNVDAYIPKEYIRGENFRIEMYKRIAQIQTQEDAYDVYDETEDRYGTVPECVSNLIDAALVRSLAQQAGITEVMEKEDGVVLSFGADAALDLEKISQIVSANKGKVLFSPSAKPYLTVRTNGKNMLNNVKNILQSYNQLNER